MLVASEIAMKTGQGWAYVIEKTCCETRQDQKCDQNAITEQHSEAPIDQETASSFLFRLFCGHHQPHQLSPDSPLSPRTQIRGRLRDQKPPLAAPLFAEFAVAPSNASGLGIIGQAALVLGHLSLCFLLH